MHINASTLNDCTFGHTSVSNVLKKDILRHMCALPLLQKVALDSDHFSPGGA